MCLFYGSWPKDLTFLNILLVYKFEVTSFAHYHTLYKAQVIDNVKELAISTFYEIVLVPTPLCLHICMQCPELSITIES